MSIYLEEFIRNSLLADAGVAALIGDRLYNILQFQQQKAIGYPAVSMQRISSTPIYAHSFDVGQQGSVSLVRFQFTIWADGKTSGKDSDTVQRAIVAAFNTFSAWQIPGSPNFFISAPNISGGGRAINKPDNNPPLFGHILDVKVWARDQ